jgi:hypothetical protein
MSVSLFRYVPLSVHGMLEVLFAPVIMAAPFVLGMGPAATVVCFMIGAILLGLSLSLIDRSVIPLTAHAEFDYVLALFAVAAGVAIGIATGDVAATIFLVGVGVAQTALTASTRFSVPRGA